MKTIRTLLLALLTPLLAASAFAADGTFNDATGSWNTPGDWVGSNIASGTSSTANFSLFTAVRTVALGAVDQTIGVINGTGGSGFGLSSTGGTLIMDNNGTQALIVNTATTATTYTTVPIVLTAGGLKITSSTGATTITGGVSGTGASAKVLELNSNSSGLFSISDITNGSGAGALGVLVNGGVIALNGTSTFTGDLTIRTGSVRATSGTNTGVGKIYLGDTSTGASPVQFAPNGGTYANDIVVSASGNGDMKIENTTSVADVSGVFNGTITLGRTLKVNTVAGGKMFLNGNISGAGKLILGSNGLANALNDHTIKGNNSFTGGLQTTGGLLFKIGSATAIGATASNWTIGGGSSTQTVNLRIDNSSGSALTMANNNAQIWSNFTFVGSDNMNMGTGGVTLSTSSAIVTVQNNKLTVDGVIAGANKSIGNAGDGIFELTGANSYTGATYVGGKLAVTSLANGGVGNTSNIGSSTNAAANLVLNRGTLQYDGGAVTTDRLFTVGNGGAIIESNGSGALNFNNIGVNFSTDNVAITLTAGSLGPAGTAPTGFVSGSTTVNQIFTGDLAVGMAVSGVGIAGGTTIASVLDGGRITLSAATTAASTATSYTFGAIDRVLTLAGSNTGANTISGVLANSASKTLGVTKAGAGTWTLAGANTYTGATTITNGTMIINGNGSAATGNVTVDVGAVLSGTGTIGGAVSVSGTLAPGNSPGILTVANDVTIADGGAFSVELNGATVGTQYDQLVLTGGGSDFSLTGTNNLVLSLGYMPAVNQLFFLTDNQGSSGIAGVFEQLNGATTVLTQGAGFTYAGQAFQISYTGNFGSSVFDGAGNDLALKAVPEPGTVAMLMGAAGMFLLLKPRRRQG